MYLRQTRRSTRDGTVIRYLQLAQNERHPRTGTPTAKVIFNFGRADDLDLDVLRRLVASVNRYLDQHGEGQDEQASGSAEEIDDGSRKTVLDAMLREAAVPEILAVCDLDVSWVFRQVWQRVSRRAGLAAAEDDVTEFVQAIEDVVVRLAAGDRLGGEIQLDVGTIVQGRRRWCDALAVEWPASFIDPDPTFVFVEAGWPMQNASDREISPEGADNSTRSGGRAPFGGLTVLAVGRGGLPIDIWTFPVEAKRKQVVRAVEKELEAHLGRAALWLGTMEDRSSVVAALGRHYLIVDRESVDPDDLREHDDDSVQVGQFHLGSGGVNAQGERVIVCNDPALARAVAAARRSTIEQLQREFVLAGELPRRRREQRLLELFESAPLPLKTGKRGNVSVDEKAIAAISQHDGHSFIRTNDVELTFAGAANSYRQALEASSDLNELHELMEDAATIDDQAAREFVCLAAFGLRRVVAARTGKSWHEVCAELAGTRLVTFVDADARRHSQMVSSSAQRELLGMLGLEPSNETIPPARVQYG